MAVSADGARMAGAPALGPTGATEDPAEAGEAIDLTASGSINATGSASVLRADGGAGGSGGASGNRGRSGIAGGDGGAAATPPRMAAACV